MRVLMLFLDGVGIGRRDPLHNPFAVAKLPAFRSLLGGELPSSRRGHLTGEDALCLPLDATLGVPGLPQSGTGQTALFTGHNAARLIGKHFGPYPFSTLRPLLETDSLFRRLTAGGKRCCFANAFPQRFFDYADRHPSRLSVTTLSCRYAGVPLLRGDDLHAGKAVSADITNSGWHALGYPHIPLIDPAEAGRRLARLTRHHDFVLFEYWKTDHAGHARSMHEALDVLEKFDGLLLGILEEVDTRDTLLMITSDHGNIEDLSMKTHTRNPVPLVLHGFRRGEFVHALSLASRSRPSLCNVTPALLDLFSLP